MSKAVITMSWDDAAHLGAKEKAEMLEATPPHLRDARSKGIPALGVGAVYPYPVSEITVAPFPIPPHWKRGFALDDGWNVTACVWLALNPDTDELFVTTEHYQKQGSPQTHATAILARGKWIPGVGDAAARTRDGEQVIEIYKAMGLNMVLADKEVEAGIYDVAMRLASARLKIFTTCQQLLREYQVYHRDDNGRIVKVDDHCLHPDTPVITEHGTYLIRELIGTEGRVLSFGGEWQHYRACRRTARNQPTVKLSFDDGSEVVCTPDHRFWTLRGWVEAIDMQGELCETVSHSIGSNHWASSLSRQPARSSRGAAITYAASICRGMASVFTVAFGSGRMAAVFRGAITSITRTVTDLITTTTILSLCAPVSMSAFTHGNMRGRFPPPPESQPPSGTGAPRAARGTRPTRSKPRGNANQNLSLVVTAAWDTKVSDPASALTTARVLGAVLPVLTKWTGFARRAAKHFKSIATPRKRIATVRAVECIAISPGPKSDVYCLEVPATSAFALANGIIVHNCMDALRYGCRPSALARMIAKPVDSIIGSPRRVGDARIGY